MHNALSLSPGVSDRITPTDGFPCQPLDGADRAAIAAGGGFPLSANDQSSICNLQSSIKTAPSLRADHLHEGLRRLTIVQRARELRATGATWTDLEETLSIPVATIIRWLKQVEHITNPTAIDCAPRNRNAGRPRKLLQFTDAEAASIKARALDINRTFRDTSLPEALRRSVDAGELRPDVADQIRARDAAGIPLLTDAARAQVELTEMEVRAHRSPRNAWLDYVQSPGSLMLTRDEFTDEERFFQPGEAYTIDDGSINLGCCVAMERPGDPCWEKFGVIVGRFQFIPVADHRTRCLLGFSYTARPRDSYRAEDLTSTMQTIFAEHGLPRIMFLEHGVSNSKLVNETLRRVGVEPRHVHSPHQKIIEKLFDLMWTKLSGLLPAGAHIGRFMGEMEEENKILTACKQGHKDPRKHFPPLIQVLAALRQAIAELNAHTMVSQEYGKWKPGEWFARDARKVTRPLAPSDAWMFAPVVRGPIKVKGFCVSTTVALMPGFSLKLHFESELLARYHGQEVMLHFNPFAPDCEATIVLAADRLVLGAARQINRHARFTRRAFGYGSEQDIGHIAARKHAQALHRTVVAIKAGGAPVATVTNAQAEQRDGLGNSVTVQVGPALRAGRNSNPQSEIRNQKSVDPETIAAARAAKSRQQADLIRQLAAQTEEEETDL